MLQYIKLACFGKRDYKVWVKNFGLSNFSSVSTVVDRIKSKLDKDHKFHSQVEEIKHNIKIIQPKT